MYNGIRVSMADPERKRERESLLPPRPRATRRASRVIRARACTDAADVGRFRREREGECERVRGITKCASAHSGFFSKCIRFFIRSGCRVHALLFLLFSLRARSVFAAGERERERERERESVFTMV